MRNGVLLMGLLSMSIASFAQEAAGFNIRGKGLQDGEKVFLMYYGFQNSERVIDSAVVKKNQFLFKGEILGPCYGAVLRGNSLAEARDKWRGDKNIWFLIFKGNTNIEYVSDKPKVVGTNAGLEAQLVYEKALSLETAAQKDSYTKDLDRLNQLKQEVTNMEKKVAKNYASREEAKYRILSSYVQANPSNEYSFYLVKQYINTSKDFSKSQALYDLLDKKFTHAGTEEKLAALKISGQLSTGTPALDFAQVDPDGNSIKLSDYKGKYVLVDFWASWCGPCRKENPVLVQAYEKFHAAGFDIIGVSLDNKKENWLTAIKADGLTWKHVSDLKGWKNEVAQQYGIQSVPANFLIDPKGNIIAKNLRGEQLSEFLAKILN